MVNSNKGASLTERSQGGFLDDSIVILKSHKTGLYTYPNSTTTINALIVEMVGEDGVEHVEGYSSGKVEATEDGTGFQSTVDKKCKAGQYIDSLLALKFPNVDTDVRVFDGTKAHVIRKALPKMGGIDKEGDKDKTVLLVDKIISLPGAKKAGATTTARPTQTSAAVTPASGLSAPAAANGAGDLNETARNMVLEILASAPDNTITRVKLGTQVMLAATKDAALKPNMQALKKLAGDSSWLIENAEAAGWMTDGETVSVS